MLGGIPYFRWAGKIGLHKLLPTRLLKSANAVTYWLFGVQKIDDKSLQKHILTDTNTRFLKWALSKIVSWENVTSIPNALHIHGTHDRLLPIRFVKPNIAIDGGGHLMVLNRSSAIQTILEQHLAENG